MIRKLGWLAAGGFAVGIVAFSLAAALGAHELEGWNLRWLLSAASSCHDDQDADLDPKASERSWAWDGGDSVEIAAPATVHYRGGSGDQVIAHGPPEALAHLRVRNGRISQSCNGRWARGDLDITLPGRVFRTVDMVGSGRLIMQDVNQPRLDLSIAGSGSVRAQGSIDLVNLSIAGAGDAKLAELTTKRLDVQIAGSGNIEAAPQDELNVKIAGSGDVRLLSNPPQVHTNIHGSGRVIRAAGQ